jgi:6 kDa early secretory antigenic target
MSQEQSWDFAGIEGSAGQLEAAAKATADHLNDANASLHRLKDAWAGAGQGAYEAVQMDWDKKSQALNDALTKLKAATHEAGQGMSQTENAVTGMF